MTSEMDLLTSKAKAPRLTKFPFKLEWKWLVTIALLLAVFNGLDSVKQSSGLTAQEIDNVVRIKRYCFSVVPNGVDNETCVLWVKELQKKGYVPELAPVKELEVNGVNG